jgi:Heparinase II/III-like protein/Heparinase II/III N-terminus
MSLFGHYWSMWRRLPKAERRLHTSRVLERWLRRDPRVRALSLAPDHPRWGAFRRALTVPPDELTMRLRGDDAARGPLFAPLAPRAAVFVRRHPGEARALLKRAEPLLTRTFDLLGSGPVRPLRADGGIDWHRDPVSGLAWDPATHHVDLVPVRGDGSDVKWPWELSRCQHLPILGIAWHVAPLVLPSDEATALRARAALEAASQLDDWIERNPRGLGVNWSCTMDVAIRAFNWTATLALFRRAAEWDDAFVRRLVRSLWTHGRHMRRNLDIGVDGTTTNHYLSNLVGLYAVGCALPEMRDAKEWRRFARRGLIEEMERQVSADGVDFERSLPYHRLAGEIFVHGALLAECGGEPLPAPFLARLALMLEFTSAATRGDGSVPQWGDNDDGRLLPLDGYATHEPNDHRHLLALGGRILQRSDLEACGEGHRLEAAWLLDDNAPPPVPAAPRGSRAFADAGYYILRGGDLHVAVPCGPVGTGGLGNHTHNDLLSIAVFAGGRAWIVDPGTGCYTRDPALRNRLRATAAHATMQLGTREQNPFGAGLDELFRITARARPEILHWSCSGKDSILKARHDGFSGPDGAWTHERSVTVRGAQRTIEVLDRLDGPAPAEPVFLRFPLAAGLDADIAPAPGPAGHARARFRVELRDAEGRALTVGLDLPPGSTAAVRPAIYSPRYGVVLESRTLVATLAPAAHLEARTTIGASG